MLYFVLRCPCRGQEHAVPAAYACQQDGSQHRCQGEPSDGMLSERYDYRGGQERSYGVASVPAYLEDGLGQAFLSS